jgi:hypothetical protein
MIAHSDRYNVRQRLSTMSAITCDESGKAELLLEVREITLTAHHRSEAKASALVR